LNRHNSRISLGYCTAHIVIVVKPHYRIYGITITYQARLSMKNLDMSLYNDILPVEKLNRLAEEEHDNYRDAQPHAHGIFDDVFNPSILKNILQEFDTEEEWKNFDTKYEKKSQLNRDDCLGPNTRAFIHSLNSGTFITFLEKLTGIKRLVADPYLAGGGLHKILPGGKLGIHTDFNRNEIINLHRRINVLVYLNEDWEESFGGHFELWSEPTGAQKTKILPIFNRMTIFNTTGNSFHGHPEPLTCPPERARKSLALYYYTAEKDELQSKNDHGTVFIDEKGRRDEIGKATLLTTIKRKLSSLMKG
jgi:Rps23 Pro-64 3,4-dihydroxylase Tpa1-like proline 4-hydroxylase